MTIKIKDYLHVVAQDLADSYLNAINQTVNQSHTDCRTRLIPGSGHRSQSQKWFVQKNGQTPTGTFELATPRDRNGTFEPQLVMGPTIFSGTPVVAEK